MDGTSGSRDGVDTGSHAESGEVEGYEPTSKLIDDALEALDRHVSDSRNEQIARALIVVGVVIALVQLVITIWPDLDLGATVGTLVQMSFLLFAAFLVIVGVFFLTVFSTQARIMRERCLKLESSRMRLIHDEKIAGLGLRPGSFKRAAFRDRDKST
jgi:hypothetical protein